jgi:hypothetical protein
MSMSKLFRDGRLAAARCIASDPLGMGLHASSAGWLDLATSLSRVAWFDRCSCRKA